MKDNEIENGEASDANITSELSEEILDKAKKEMPEIVELLGEKGKRVIAESVSASVSATITKSSPLPEPKDFEAYESVLPGAADRIMSQSEKEQSHRHEMNIREQEYFHDSNKKLTSMGIIAGTVISMTGIITGATVMILESPWFGVPIVLVSMGGVIANILRAGKNEEIK